MAECDCESPVVPPDWIESDTWDGTCRRCGRELPQSWWTAAPYACDGCGDPLVPLREVSRGGKTARLCAACAAA